MKIISKHQGKRTYIHDININRRKRCPSWNFSNYFITNLKEGAKYNKMSTARFFESVVNNFFILEKQKILNFVNKSYKYSQKKQRTPSMALHPKVLTLLNNYSLISNISPSCYIENLFNIYFYKYSYEIKLNNLLKK